MSTPTPTALKGWIRVASGLRMVAEAATSNASREGGQTAASVSRHGAEFMNNLKFVATDVTSRQQQQQQQQGIHRNDRGSSSTTTMRFDKEDNNEEKATQRMAYALHERTVVDESRSSVFVEKDVYDSLVRGTTEQADSQPRTAMTTVDGDRQDSVPPPPPTEEIPSFNRQQQQHQKIDEIPKSTTSSSSHTSQPSSSTITNTHTNTTPATPPLQTNQTNQQLQEGQPVPSTRISRAFGFASLGIGLAAGTTVEIASRLINRVTTTTTTTPSSSSSSSSSPVVNDANADRLVQTLCRMRGAALKLGQMLSIQDETLLPPVLANALEQVRQNADAMPIRQLREQMEKELGVGWEEEGGFVTFEDRPFAAASIGQVHRASVRDDDGGGGDGIRQVVVKVQYPGVANSIESDLANLSMLITMSGLAPPGLFIERVIEVGRRELTVECDYVQEMHNQKKMKELIENDADLTAAKFVVPDVVEDLCTSEILTTEFCPGGTIDKVMFLDQNERNRIGRNILRLTMKELFVWRFVQTDPNWGNFLYDVGTGTTYLIDFGSTLEYDRTFVDGYLRIVWAAANSDVDALMDQSLKMGFLTGEENDIMLEAHKKSGFTMGDPFAKADTYDFGASGITGRMSEHGSAFLQHRLTPPPEEVYTLHRKLVGAYNLCIKLGAKIECRSLLEEIVKDHVFEDGQDHPLQKRDLLTDDL